MTFYLCIGLLISALLVLRPTLPTLVIACAYWLTATLWALGLIQPFVFGSIYWVKFFDINIAYHIDGLSQLFTLLIAGIGVVVLIYSWFYTSDTPYKRAKLLSLLQLFAISMLGVVLADDMIMLFLCWELTSISSYLLIQFDVHDKDANQAAFNSLFVGALGGLSMLIGFILLNQLTDSWSISHAITQLSSNGNKQLTLAFYLILGGVITKSAQFPFYFWLTGAMKAPTPVSAYLHSATIVNAGIYLLARFHPLFSSLDVWYPVLSVLGLVTMTLSSFLSLFQRDLKTILAYTTIFALGAMVYLLASVNSLLLEAFTIFILFHGIYKAAAFMLVGILDKTYHTRDLGMLDGVARQNLVLGISTAIIFAAMAGIPPFFGFTIKEIIYQGKLASSAYSSISMSILSSMLIAATSFRCLWYLFKPANKGKTVPQIKTGFNMIYICPAFLTILIILFSIFDRYTGFLIEPAFNILASANGLFYISPNTKASFLLSLITSVGGLFIFSLSFFIKMPPWSWFEWLGLKTLFESALNGFLNFGKKITQFTQGLTFTHQLRVFFVGILFMMTYLLIVEPGQVVFDISQDLTLPTLLFCCFLLLSSLSLLASYQFLYNLISLGLIGLSVSFFFIVSGAVDVAITQLLVEVLTIIILLVALRKTNVQSHKESRANKLVNGVIASMGGGIVTYMLYAYKTSPFNTQLQDYYIDNSLVSAYGRNVVNVILVDFRSLDTFGEAMVIVSTAIGAILLLKKYIALKR